MMFQLPPVRINLPKPKPRRQEVLIDDGRKVKCKQRDTYLDLSQMSLNQFPYGVLRCTDIQVLLLGRNFIRKVPRSIGKLDYIEILDLSYNRLTEISDAILSLTGLRDLDLSHNCISDIPIDIRFLKYLKVLNLSYNRIKKLPNNLQHLTSLVELNISSNKIREYPVSLCSSFSQLRLLTCSYNLIEELPYELILLPEQMLETGSIDFTHNPLSWPPVSVVAKGLTAVRNYMEPKWRDLREFKRRKMFYDSLKANNNRNINKTNLWHHKIEEEVANNEKRIQSQTSHIDTKVRQPQVKPQVKPQAHRLGSRGSSRDKERSAPPSRQRKRSKTEAPAAPKELSAPDEDNTSQVTLVEVYGDMKTPTDYLTPVPDHLTPAGDHMTPADYMTPEDEQKLGASSHELLFDDDHLAELDLEPPDLDIPYEYSSTGGGNLEQWLGTIQSLAASDPNLKDEISSLHLAEEDSHYTPFSDVKIVRKAGNESDSPLEDDDRNSDDNGGSLISIDLRDVTSNRTPDQLSPKRSHGIIPPSSPSGRSLVSFSTEIMMESKDCKSAKTSDRKAITVAYKSKRSSSRASFFSSSPQKVSKKKKRKKKKKKVERQESELEFYSRIPTKPLSLGYKYIPYTKGLRTWSYFTEPPSCYLLDNLAGTGKSARKKKVTFGTEEITILSSTPSHVSNSCWTNSESSLLESSLHSIDSVVSQQLTLTPASLEERPSMDLVFPGAGDVVAGTPPSLQPPSIATQNCRYGASYRRASSLHSAKDDPWTEGDLTTFIYRPPSQVIPPRVLVAYYSVEKDEILRSQILKLARTIEHHGFAECVCGVGEDEDTFDEDGYYTWLEQNVKEVEFILYVFTPSLIKDAKFLNKLSAYGEREPRLSPYVTEQDLLRWDLLDETQLKHRILPIIFDDTSQLIKPFPWITALPYYVPSELCELGYSLVTRDLTEARTIPKLYGGSCGGSTDGETPLCTSFFSVSESCGNLENIDLEEDEGEGEGRDTLPADVYRITPVTAHLLINARDVVHDFRLVEIAGKIRHDWLKFAKTCGIKDTLIEEINSVYSSILEKAIQCLKAWRSMLVGKATYHELSRRLDQIDRKYVADAYCKCSPKDGETELWDLNKLKYERSYTFN